MRYKIVIELDHPGTGSLAPNGDTYNAPDLWNWQQKLGAECSDIKVTTFKITEEWVGGSEYPRGEE